MCVSNVFFTPIPSLSRIMATEIDKLDDAIKAVELKIESIDKQLLEKGLSDEKEIALLNKATALIKDRTSLREQRQVLIAGTSAPSGNPISLSQSLHKVFECVVVMSFPLFCRGSSCTSHFINF